MYRKKSFNLAIRYLSCYDLCPKTLSDHSLIGKSSTYTIYRNISILHSQNEKRLSLNCNFLKWSERNETKTTKRNISGPSSWKQKKSHYVILEVSPTATSKDIKDAFIRLSKKYHPDLNPDGQSKEETERFQMVVEAYEVLGDPIRKKEYDASLGLSRRLPFRRSKVPGESEYDEAGNKVNGPMYGVDPEFGRTIDVDLSEERMKKAWKAYKIRWDKEEENLRALEEKKLEFRIMMDKKREMYEVLTPEEQAEYKDSIRLFRHPDFAKKSGNFHDLHGNVVNDDPYSSYTSAFKKRMKDKYNIILDDEKYEKSSTSDAGNPATSQESMFPERKNAYRQDLLSHNKSKKFKQRETSETLSNSPILNDNSQYGDEIIENRSREEKTFEKQNNDATKKSEIDEIVEAMQTPNPTTHFYTSSGVAVHHDNKKREALWKKQLENMDAWSSPQKPEHEGIRDIPESNYDPVIQSIRNTPRDNTSYFTKWKQNVEDQSKSDIHSDDSRDSFVKSRSFIIFSCTVIVSILTVMIKNSGGHDIPLNSESDKSK